ncbi:unnamed protein product [Callosobruchus maculatus]|uniref:Uncharacterized protein n=1 Tax=Callosobruchus maculatus TaxID=64391 RepID=A0A653CV60_CALMS|nr:unnamed protein product [Callosobruchus maculatus]
MLPHTSKPPAWTYRRRVRLLQDQTRIRRRRTVIQLSLSSFCGAVMLRRYSAEMGIYIVSLRKIVKLYLYYDNIFSFMFS